VAEATAQRWGKQLVVRTGQQLVPEWAADLANADVVYFVDASLEVAEAQLVPVAADSKSSPIDAHEMSPNPQPS
jgi:hypothetical protein